VPQKRQGEEIGRASHDRHSGKGGRVMADSGPMDDSARSLLEQFVKAANLSAGALGAHYSRGRDLLQRFDKALS
jgi:hypothetical protein